MRGQAHILPTPANSETELIVGNDDLNFVFVLIQNNFGNLGRRQAVDNEGRRVIGPLDDIDFFALQFTDDRLDARTAHTDTRPNRIDARIMRQHGDLGARTWVAGNRLDLNNAIVNFWHFLGKQHPHKLRMCPRQKNLRPAGFLADIDNIGAHPVTVVEVLAGDTFITPQHCFGAAQINDHVAVFDTLDQAIDDFANPVLVFAILTRAFGFADFLNDNLFRSLRGDPAKIDGRQRINQEFTGLGVFFFAARRFQIHLRELIFNQLGRFHDLDVAGQGYSARNAVNMRANVMLMAVFGTASFLNGLLHGFQHFIAFDSLVASDGLRDLQKLGARIKGFGVCCSFVHLIRVLVACPCGQSLRRGQVLNPEFVAPPPDRP